MTEELTISSAEWFTVPEVAERLDIRITKVHRMINDHQLLAQRRDGILRIPTELVTTDDRIAGHIAGVINVLRDAGLSDEELFRWLFTPEDSLNGTPAQALHGHKAREVKRRAQALAL